MKLGGLDWARANSDCPSVFGLELGGPCGVVGLSRLQSGGDWTVGTCGRSYCYLVVWGAHIEVALCLQHVLLCRNPRIMSQSCDLFSFCEEALCTLGVGVGVEGGVSGHVVGQVCLGV